MQLAPAAIDVPLQVPRPAQPYRVLVVDDNEDAADALAQRLRLDGHDVEVAYNGMCALARIRAHRPEVVLCDLGLPELSGFDLARVIRRERAATIRLVAISGYARPEDIQRSLEAGFDAHLAKPARPGDIESLLIRFSGS